MAGTEKKFKDLKDFEVVPPRSLFARIWQKIMSSGRGNVMSQAEKEEQPNYKRIFAELQSYTDAGNKPPEFDYNAVEADLQSKAKTEKSFFQLHFYKILTAAAVVAGLGIFIYIKNNTHKNDNIASLYGKSQQNKQAIDKNNYGTATQGHDQTEIIVSLEKPAKHHQSPATNLVDDDFIYTYTNFNYEEATGFLNIIKKNAVIFINEFSYVNVSDKMSAFFEKLYETNKRNKPTWKAKRLKKKLNKWKKKDENYFDSGLQHNPLDIVDLSEFIFKN